MTIMISGKATGKKDGSEVVICKILLGDRHLIFIYPALHREVLKSEPVIRQHNR